MAVYNVGGNRIDGSQKSMRSLADYGNLSTAAGFLSAFNAAVADMSICGVAIPYGEYTISAQLNMRSNFTVDGNGCKINGSGDHRIFRLIDVDNCTIKNVNIDMHQTNSMLDAALYVRDANNISFEKITIENIGGLGCLAYTTDEDIFMDNISFKEVIMKGIGGSGQGSASNAWERPCGIIAVNCRDSIFEDCFVSGMKRFSLEFKNFSGDCHIVNNVVHGSMTGIALGGDADESYDTLGYRIVIDGNVVSESNYPLYLGRAGHLIVSNNYLDDGSLFIQGIHDCVLSGNIIRTTDISDVPTKSGEYWTRYASIWIDGTCENVHFLHNDYETGENIPLIYVTQTADLDDFVINGYHEGELINITDPTNT